MKRTFGGAEKAALYEKTLNKMRFILHAYAKRNPFVGYCQGMNFVLEFLLRQNFSEEVWLFLMFPIYFLELLGRILAFGSFD